MSRKYPNQYYFSLWSTIIINLFQIIVYLDKEVYTTPITNIQIKFVKLIDAIFLTIATIFRGILKKKLVSICPYLS